MIAISARRSKKTLILTMSRNLINRHIPTQLKKYPEETKETNSKSSNQTTKEKDTPKKKNGKLNKFLKKIGVEEEEKKEVEFEIDQNF